MARKIKAESGKSIIAFAAPVTIKASEGEGNAKSAPSFDVVAYNGGALEVGGWDRPVVIDLDGLTFSRNVIANLDHNSRQRVGHVTEKSKADGAVKLSGTFSAATPFRAEVVDSAKEGFEWEASVEVTPTKIVEVEAGKTAKVNGQEFTGPLYVARKGVLSGFAFVSHGADPTTNVKIAARAASQKEQRMNPEFKKWIEAMGFTADDLSEDQLANLQADYEGRDGTREKKKVKATSPFEAAKLEAKRREEIQEISDKIIERRGIHITASEIAEIEAMQDHAIETGMTPLQYRVEIQEATLPQGRTISSSSKRDEISAEVVEAAICVHGHLGDVEKRYSDKVLQAAHNRFRHSIGLQEILMMAAQSNGYHARPGERVTDGNLRNVLQFAFSPIKAQGWSTFSLPVALGNVANKFIREGWNFVEQEWRQISTVRSVTDFKEITTTSLFDGLMYEPLSPNGQIKHGTVGETTYGNKADTYARMFTVDRRDIINDNLGALTQVPRKLGRGGALKLNDIFWAEWINPSINNFWHSGNANVNEGVATMTVGGLSATEVIFMAQTGPDGNLLGAIPAILLVPPVHKTAALTLMESERLIDGTSTAVQGDANVFRGRFKVVCSQYLGSTAFTGYDIDAWWLLANPNDIAGIEVVALNGRVEPIVDAAEADFDTLGIQMRGYCDIGVRVQEKRCGVRADNGAS